MDRDVVASLVDNPEFIATYADAPCAQVRDSVEYVIITNEELKDASGDYTFQDLLFLLLIDLDFLQDQYV